MLKHIANTTVQSARSQVRFIYFCMFLFGSSSWWTNTGRKDVIFVIQVIQSGNASWVNKEWISIFQLVSLFWWNFLEQCFLAKYVGLRNLPLYNQLRQCGGNRITHNNIFFSEIKPSKAQKVLKSNKKYCKKYSKIKPRRVGNRITHNNIFFSGIKT